DYAPVRPDAHRDRFREELDHHLSLADRDDAPAQTVHRRRKEVVTTDEGFREIQLNGKQLVFLFMAATVVSVVIFLCGVLVGRGVRAERGGPSADLSVINTVSPAESTPPPSAAPPAPAGSDPTTAAAPPPAADDLSYFSRLEKPGRQTEALKPNQPKVPAEKA